jgi:hypothetical protein
MTLRDRLDAVQPRRRSDEVPGGFLVLAVANAGANCTFDQSIKQCIVPQAGSSRRMWRTDFSYDRDPSGTAGGGGS